MTEDNDAAKSFGECWPKIGPHVTRTAISMLGYHDGQDVAQEVAIQMLNSDEDRSNAQKLAGYWRRKTKWACLDFMRRRNRTVLTGNIEEYETRSVSHSYCVHDDLAPYIPEEALSLLLAGFSQNEVAKRLGKSKAFISRMMTEARNKANNKESDDMSSLRNKVQTHKKDGSIDVRVYAGKTWIATANVVPGKADASVTMRKGVAIDPQEIKEYVNEAYPEGAPIKVKQEKTRSSSGMLDELKDFPATLDAWTKKVGGKGKCLGGSGKDVSSRFAPGWDAKLKSALKRVGTPNAKALAKELGWSKMIKWND